MKTNTAFLIMVLGITSLLVSCQPEPLSKEEIILVFDATDTIPPDSFYYAKIYIENKPTDFRIEGYYFSDVEIYQQGDTAHLSFNTSCSPDSILKLRSSKFFEKYYTLSLKGTLKEKDTTITVERAYYVNCNK